MADRMRTEMQIHGGRYERPWVVYLDGQLLRDSRGGARRFKTADAARSAGGKALWRTPTAQPFGVGTVHPMVDGYVASGLFSGEEHKLTIKYATREQADAAQEWLSATADGVKTPLEGRDAEA